MVTIKIEDANRKWIGSVISRGIGIVIAVIFGFLTTILNGDKLIDSIAMILMVILIFLLIIVAPDKLIFGKNLVNKNFKEKD